MSKTPVSIVQEICAKFRITPQYDLLINEHATNNLYFKYKLIVDDIVGFGSGKSKKEAKHEAAKNIYSHLCKKYVSLDLPVMPEEAETLLDITSPYQGTVKENVIGDLGNICSERTYPSPHYELIGEEGPPHEKTFTFTCSVGNLKESASSRTKQQAKHHSATLMLNRLKKLQDDSETILTKAKTIDESGGKPDLHDDYISLETYKNESNTRENELNAANIKAGKEYILLKNRTMRQHDAFNIPLKDYHKLDLSTVFDMTHECIEKLRSYSNVNSNPCDLLAEIAESEGKIVSYLKIPSLNSRVLCVCQLNSPYFTTQGIGASECDAQVKAARNMLMHLHKLL